MVSSHTWNRKWQKLTRQTLLLIYSMLQFQPINVFSPCIIAAFFWKPAHWDRVKALRLVCQHCLVCSRHFLYILFGDKTDKYSKLPNLNLCCLRKLTLLHLDGTNIIKKCQGETANHFRITNCPNILLRSK